MADWNMTKGEEPPSSGRQFYISWWRYSFIKEAVSMSTWAQSNLLDFWGKDKWENDCISTAFLQSHYFQLSSSLLKTQNSTPLHKLPDQNPVQNLHGRWAVSAMCWQLCEAGSADPGVWRRAGQHTQVREALPGASSPARSSARLGTAGWAGHSQGFLRQLLAKSPGCVYWEAHLAESSRVYLC